MAAFDFSYLEKRQTFFSPKLHHLLRWLKWRIIWLWFIWTWADVSQAWIYSIAISERFCSNCVVLYRKRERCLLSRKLAACLALASCSSLWADLSLSKNRPKIESLFSLETFQQGLFCFKTTPNQLFLTKTVLRSSFTVSDCIYYSGSDNTYMECQDS